ncbi:MAG: ATP-binding protein [Candidatus Obscuribacterales bacterium]|nr:ATP-binding protein [Candidatus Obscuribacterales bacterium]
MRITLTGASSVGKTSLAEALAEALQYPLIPELARELCRETGYERIGEIPDQEGFKRQVLAKQIEREKSLRSFVADRSAIDAWVLWQRWNLCSAMTYDSESFYNIVRDHCRNYTHIIYIPPLITPSEDDFRWTDKDYQKQIDRLTKSTLFDLNLLDRTYTITSTDFVERCAEVLQWLQK